jgi:hypothetical protein
MLAYLYVLETQLRFVCDKLIPNSLTTVHVEWKESCQSGEGKISALLAENSGSYP